MYKFLAGAVLCLSLAVATGCGSNYNSDEVPDVSPDLQHRQGRYVHR